MRTLNEKSAEERIRRVKGCSCPSCVRDVVNGDLTPEETRGCDLHPLNRESLPDLPSVSTLRDRLERVPDDGNWHEFSKGHWTELRSECNGVRQWNCFASMRHGTLLVRREPGTKVERGGPERTLKSLSE